MAKKKVHNGRKSEIRNPQQAHSELNLKSGNFKTRNPNEACFGFAVFDHLNLFRPLSFGPRGFFGAANFCVLCG